MRKELFIFIFLLIALIICAFDFKKSYEYYELSKHANPIRTKGVVTGYSTGGRNHRYFVKWFDIFQKEHHTNSINISPLPEVGDSVGVIYFINDTNFGIIETDYELLGGLKNKGFKLLIVIFINIGFLIYYLRKRIHSKK